MEVPKSNTGEGVLVLLLVLRFCTLLDPNWLALRTLLALLGCLCGFGQAPNLLLEATLGVPKSNTRGGVLVLLLVLLFSKLLDPNWRALGVLAEASWHHNAPKCWPISLLT